MADLPLDVNRLVEKVTVQSQASLTDQLRCLYAAAIRLGLYDAADWLQRRHNSERPDVEQKAEDRWTTQRHLVWQGWQDNVHPSRLGVGGDSMRFYVDDDGGLWMEADPTACLAEGKHVPRWHPAEFVGWFYCTRCGAQGVNADG